MKSPEYFYFVMSGSGLVLALVERVDGALAKGVGVLGRKTLPAGEGIWLPHVASVHTFFVAFPLDIVFLSADFTVLAAHPGTPPWRPLIRCSGAVHTVEMGAGTLSPGAVTRGARARMDALQHHKT